MVAEPERTYLLAAKEDLQRARMLGDALERSRGRVGMEIPTVLQIDRYLDRSAALALVSIAESLATIAGAVDRGRLLIKEAH